MHEGKVHELRSEKGNSMKICMKCNECETFFTTDLVKVTPPNATSYYKHKTFPECPDCESLDVVDVGNPPGDLPSIEEDCA